MNVSETQNLIKSHSSLNGIPGYVVVVFKKLDQGGAKFVKVVSSNERFKKFFPFWNSLDKYFAIAVNQSVLHYTFETRVILDGAIHQFTVLFDLTYRAKNPRLLAELHGQDPLRRLRDRIIEVISRSCETRKWEMVEDCFQELERMVVEAEWSELSQYAATLGTEIISLKLNRQLPTAEMKVAEKVFKSDIEKEKFEIEYERVQHRARLLQLCDDAIARALSNIAEGIGTPNNLQEALNVIREINRSGSDEQHLLNAKPAVKGLLAVRAGGDAQTKDLPTDEESKQVLGQQVWESDTETLIQHLIDIGMDNELAAKARDALKQMETELFPKDVLGAKDPIGNQAIETVACTVFAPRKTRRGSSILVQVFAHFVKDADVVKTLACDFDPEAQRLAFKRLGHELEQHSKLVFYLSMSGVQIDEPVQELIWRGHPEAVQFGVRIPHDNNNDELVGTIYVSQNTVPFGHLKFLLRIEDDDLKEQNPAPETLNTWKRYEYAFISYASQDRSEVLKRVQMLSRFHIDFFQDLLTLEPGEVWEETIYKSIDRSDVFFLFWSSAARDSEWVMKEVRYALQKKGSNKFAPPEIVPIIIEGPPPVPPPVELRDIHFNDVFIYFIN
jgi:TIR domain